MRQVAEDAGVSIASVSRVLNGSRTVTPELVQAVREASERLGYRTNYVARALRQRSTQTVGMVVPHIANPYFPGVVQAVERNLSTGDHDLFLCDSQDDPEIEAERVRGLLSRQIDGLLIIPCDERASSATIREARRHVPVVQVDRHAVRARTDRIYVDDHAGIRAVLEHLAALGRRRLAFVGAQPTISTAHRRLDAYLAEVRKLDPASAERVLLGDFSLEWGQAATFRLLDQRPWPDAVICGNDLIAIGVVNALRAAEVGLRDVIAVTGFDDIGFATVCSPPLTTVRQPIDELGAAATGMLLDRLAGDERPPRTLCLTPELVVRGSTVSLPRVDP